MTIGINQLFHSEVVSGKRVVRSALPINLSEVAAYNAPTVIYADQVIVEGRVSLPGQIVEIYCRQLHARNGATIDTSGVNGTRTFPPEARPQTPDIINASGESGADADDGSSAGSVVVVAYEVIGTLTIKALGGTGGRGQDGGHGRPGGPGVDGQNAPDLKLRYQDPIPTSPWLTCNARTGAGGGDGGDTGRSGHGGNGGNVTIQLVKASAQNQISVNNGKGYAGPNASPGRGGGYGPMPTPGTQRVFYCTESDIGHPREPFIPEALLAAEAQLLSGGEPGKVAVPVGFTGTFVKEVRLFRLDCEHVATLTGEIYTTMKSMNGSVKFGRDGADGTMRVGQLSPRDFAGAFQGTFLEMLCWSIEDDYRKRGTLSGDDLAAKVSFLFAVCSDDHEPDTLKQRIMARVFSLQRKAGLNLDYYGYTLEDAPLLTFQTYSNIVSSDLFGQLMIVEQAYRTALDTQITVEQRRNAILQSLNAIETINSSLTLVYDKTLVITQELAADIKDLESQVLTARAVLESNRDALDKAIRNRSNQSCDFVSVATSVLTICVSIQTGVGAIQAIADAAGTVTKYFAVHQTLKDLWENRSVLDKNIKTISEKYTDFQDAITKVGNEVKNLSPQQREVPSLQMQRDHFDMIAREFVEFPEAQAYRNAGYAFLRIAEARNQTVLDFNAALVRLLELQVQQAAYTRLLVEKRSQLTGSFDPGKSLIFGLLTQIYRDTLSFGGALIHAERKAQGYLFNEPARVSLSELDASSLAAAHRQTMQDWLDAKEAFRVKRELARDVFTFDILDFCDGDTSEQWLRFKTEGKISFALRRDHPKYFPDLKNLPGLRITGITVDLSGISRSVGDGGAANQIYWLIGQAGMEAIFRRDGSRVSFRHRAIQIPGSSHAAGGPALIEADFSEAGLYAGVSPFAHWEFSLVDFYQFAIADAFRIKFRIRGYFIQ